MMTNSTSQSTTSQTSPHDAVWVELEQRARTALTSGVERRRITSPDARAIFLGYEVPENRRLFLLRLRRDQLAPRLSLPDVQGIHLWIGALPHDEPDHVSIVLTLREPHYVDIFSALVDDLIRHVEHWPNDASAAKALVDRLALWQHFLERHSNGLGPEAQRGLWGELLFLRDKVLPILGDAGVSGWTGAEGAPHDFQFPVCAVEVKTSTGTPPYKIRVSNERQLDDTLVHLLFLYHLALEPMRNMGETLPDIITSLRQVLKEGAARRQFEDALLAAGYLDVQAPRYSSIGYGVREESFFRVSDGFPRLIDKDLPLGVGAVSYDLSVDQCRQFSAPLTDLNVLATSSQPATP